MIASAKRRLRGACQARVQSAPALRRARRRFGDRPVGRPSIVDERR
jgi:hypothetical protein